MQMPPSLVTQRAVLATVGIYLDTVSTDVLVLGLRADGAGHVDRLLNQAADAGEPLRLTLRMLQGTPVLGKPLYATLHATKKAIKDAISPQMMFEDLGLKYIGPVDGHNVDALIKNLEFAKHCDVPVLVHVLTKKGKGLEAAVAHPEKFHGASPFAA